MNYKFWIVFVVVKASQQDEQEIRWKLEATQYSRGRQQSAFVHC